VTANASNPKRPVAAGVLVLLIGVFIAAAPAEAALPGMNGKIAYDSNENANNHEIYLVNPDRTGGTRVTNNTWEDKDPAWSPDGTRIAFYSAQHGNNEIYVMNADGSSPRRLTTDPASDWYPSWSPDGRIVFVRGAEIWVMNSDGSGQRKLITEPGFNPVWSPDGARLAFTSFRDEPNIGTCNPCNSEIYVINIDGSGLTRLTNSSAADANPAWSPDSVRIAFDTTRDVTPLNPSNYEIYTIDTNNLLPTRLTNNSAFDGTPTWSPDGSRIAFTRNSDIWVMNATGGGETNLTNSAAQDFLADWQRQLPPVAALTASPSAVNTGQGVTFSATGSFDPAGFIASYRWDLDGDGSYETDTGRTPTASNSYPTARSVSAGLLVVDNDGLTSAARTTVNVSNRPPRAFMSVSKNPAEPGDRVIFDGSGSSDPDGTITNYKWDLDGNGSFETDTGGTPRATKRFANAGSVRVSLRTTDNNGASSETLQSLTVRSVITAGVRLNIGVARGGVRVNRFWVDKVPRGSRVEARCASKRCKGQVIRKSKSSQVTFRRFSGKTLKTGTVIEIRISKRGWIGRYASIKIKTGAFNTVFRCMKPGSRKPARKC
jgi:YD repeat-containing protein